MILTPSYSIPKGINSAVFSINNGKYCERLQNVIAHALSKGYILPTQYQLRCINFLLNELEYNKIIETYDLLYILGFNSLRSYNRKYIPAEFNVGRPYIIDTTIKFASINYINPNKNELIRIQGSRDNYPYYGPKGIVGNSSGISNIFSGWNTQFLFGVDNIKWIQNNAGFSFYAAYDLDEAGTGNNWVCGLRDSVNLRTYIRCTRLNGTNFQFNINATTTTLANIANTNLQKLGWFRIERSASNLSTLYIDGNQIGTATQASGTLIPTTHPLILQSYSTDGTLSGASMVSPLSYYALGSHIGLTLQKTEFQIFTEFRNRLNYN
jgi:hypothetical protein